MSQLQIFGRGTMAVNKITTYIVISISIIVYTYGQNAHYEGVGDGVGRVIEG